MNDKNEILRMLKEEFNQWEELLRGLREEYITNPQLPSGLSIKDVVAHLWAWQQRSIARLEAGLRGQEPDYPDWPAEFDPEEEGEPHELNDWIHSTYRDKSWPDVYRDWKEGFLHFLELGQAMPEKDLFDKEKFPWMEGYSLANVLLGSYEHHHHDHLETLHAWLERKGAMSSTGGVPDEQSPISDQFED